MHPNYKFDSSYCDDRPFITILFYIPRSDEKNRDLIHTMECNKVLLKKFENTVSIGRL